MDFKDPKTREKIGILLLAVILGLSGYLMIREKPAPVEFKENVSAKLSDQNVSQVQATNPNEVKAKININKASVEELDTLPGIGEKTAAKIVDYRTQHIFKTIEEIKEVNGIGEVKYSQIKDLISI